MTDADDASTEIPKPAEQPPVNAESAEPEKNAAERKAELKSQVMGLMTLVIVFGLLWGLVKVMPTLGDKLQTGIGSVLPETEKSEKAETQMRPVSEAEAEGATKTEADEPVSVPTVAKLKPVPKKVAQPLPIPAPAPAPTTESLPVPDDGTIPDEKVKAQILEALGGAERGEVRHIAFSSDLSKMITSLKIMPESGESQLVEVVFERDDFGRYISTEESPLDSQITIWK